jgi:hypothetical protein
LYEPATPVPIETATTPAKKKPGVAARTTGFPAII